MLSRKGGGGGGYRKGLGLQGGLQGWAQGPSGPGEELGRHGGHPYSGQLQELLQCVLFHGLHEEFIVLREG